jgi:hypothetical protein
VPALIVVFVVIITIFFSVFIVAIAAVVNVCFCYSHSDYVKPGVDNSTSSLEIINTGQYHKMAE